MRRGGAGKRHWTSDAEMRRRNYRSFDEAFLADCEPTLADFYALWKRKTAPDRLPARADFEPEELRDWLPGIILADVERPSLQIRYRLVGTREVEHRGLDPTGKLVIEAFCGLNAEYCEYNYRYVAETGKPLFDRSPEPTAYGNLADVQSLFLPLASDGETVDMILAYSTRLGLVHQQQERPSIG